VSCGAGGWWCRCSEARPSGAGLPATRRCRSTAVRTRAGPTWVFPRSAGRRAGPARPARSSRRSARPDSSAADRQRTVGSR